MRIRIRSIVALMAAALCLAGPASAGQVRVNVTSNAFVPEDISINQGDQVVWFWVGGGHTVTSGNGCTPSGPFSSPTLFGGARFSWKSVSVGSVNYFCIPHCPSMTGSISVAASGANVADFRITEVRVATAPPHTVDFIEIANLGTASGNLGRYRVTMNGIPFDIPMNDLIVAAGARVVVHPGSSGTNTATNLFVPAVTLTIPGSAGLYVPNSVNGSLLEPTMLVDFVQWGAGAQPTEVTAAAALYWTAGGFIPQVADGHSMEFCGLRTDRGPTFWKGISVPNPGSNGNCSTPTSTATWGTIKTLYR